MKVTRRLLCALALVSLASCTAPADTPPADATAAKDAPALEAPKPTVKAIPDGYHTITPGLVVPDITAAVLFYEKAFGAKRREMSSGPDGKVMHGEIMIGDSMVMLGLADAEHNHKTPAELGGTVGSLNYYVPDADATFKAALDAGAKELMPVEDQFWGDRWGMLTDPFGHAWGIGTGKVVLTDAQVSEGAQAAFDKNKKKAKTAIAKLWEQGTPAKSYKQEGYFDVTPSLHLAGGADLLAFYEKGLGGKPGASMPGEGGKLMHAEVTLGDSRVMFASEMPEHGSKSAKTLGGSTMFLYVYVPKVDEVMTAAAPFASKHSPAQDMFWGDKVGNLTDPSGVPWSIATHVRDVTPADMQKAMADMAQNEPAADK